MNKHLIKYKAKYAEKRRILGRLKGAVLYKLTPDNAGVVIGWITPSAARLGEKQEVGAQTAISEKERKFFWASGIPLSKNKTNLNIAARPTITPISLKEKDKMIEQFHSKFIEYIRKGKG